MTAGTDARPACPDCAAGHDHCHGTLVAHRDGALECVASGPCGDAAADRHALAIDCRELGPSCDCAGRGAAAGGR